MDISRGIMRSFRATIITLWAKFLVSLLLGCSVVAAIAVWMIYTTATNELRNQTQLSSRLLSSAINHATMVATHDSDIAHIAKSILIDEPIVQSILIATNNPLKYVVEFHQPNFVPSDNGVRMREWAQKTLATGEFGQHFEENGDFYSLLPLQSMTQMMGSGHDMKHNTVSNSADEATKHNTHHTMMAAAEKPANSPSNTYRGVILIRTDAEVVRQANINIVSNAVPIFLVGIFTIMILAYGLLHLWVLRPLKVIQNTMKKQEAGQIGARVKSVPGAEMRDIAFTLNDMLDALTESEENLKYQIAELRDREERLEKQASEMIGVAEELAIAEEKMKFLAYHDALTGLPSLRLCKDRIDKAIASAKRDNTQCAVMFIDLDGFKNVNDTLGHEVGDSVLKKVGERILANIRDVDTAARIGGDEFIAVLTGVKTPNDVAQLAQRINAALSKNFEIENSVATIGASIGIALYPNDGTTSEELLRKSDQSMYEIKKQNKNSFAFASPLSQVG